MYNVTNPNTGKIRRYPISKSIEKMNKLEVAQIYWANKSLATRIKKIKQIKAILETNKHLLAESISNETGKHYGSLPLKFQPLLVKLMRLSHLSIIDVNFHKFVAKTK